MALSWGIGSIIGGYLAVLRYVIAFTTAGGLAALAGILVICLIGS